MLALEDRVLAVLTDVWRQLPPIKHQSRIQAVGLEDLGAKHGGWDPETQVLTLSTRLFWGDTPAQLPMLDVNGDSPPLTVPCVSRAWHTTAHELFHAIGTATGLDSTAEWFRLSGWLETPEDLQSTGRYYERRPGWEPGFSSWRYRRGAWFVRPYSTKTPHEDFADTATHVLLGWTDMHGTPNGLAKLRYLRKHVWQETGTASLIAAASMWRGRFQAVQQRKKRPHSVLPLLLETEEVVEAAARQRPHRDRK